MSVELLDTARFHGFRVRRQVAGKTYQEYFSLKKNGKKLRGYEKEKVKSLVAKRDAVLERMQLKAKAERAKSAIFNDCGKVRGVIFRLKKEKSGTLTPVFQIGIMSDRLQKIVNTTVSINMHGLKVAWQRAVDFYAFHKRISKQSVTYKKLLRYQPTRSKLEAMASQAIW